SSSLPCEENEEATAKIFPSLLSGLLALPVFRRPLAEPSTPAFQSLPPPGSHRETACAAKKSYCFPSSSRRNPHAPHPRTMTAQKNCSSPAPVESPQSCNASASPLFSCPSRGETTHSCIHQSTRNISGKIQSRTGRNLPIRSEFLCGRSA